MKRWRAWRLALVGDVERLGDEDRRLVLGCGVASTEDALQSKLSQEVSAGSMLRVLKRDPGLIDAGNGGTGMSVNYDDGNTRHGDGVECYASDRFWPDSGRRMADRSPGWSAMFYE